MTYYKSKEEILEHLREELQFLRSSSNTYDSGEKSEAKRIATTIRVILHDSNSSSNSVSLLKHLGKGDMKFYDTSYKYPKNSVTLAFTPLIMVSASKDRGSYEPVLDRGPPPHYIAGKIPFNSWWNMPILANSQGNFLTRRNLVLMVSNKDGGAHVDDKLDDYYAALTRENTLGWRHISPNNGITDIMDAELASLRQIAHEILKSFAEEFPEY